MKTQNPWSPGESNTYHISTGSKSPHQNHQSWTALSHGNRPSSRAKSSGLLRTASHALTECRTRGVAQLLHPLAHRLQIRPNTSSLHSTSGTGGGRRCGSENSMVTESAGAGDEASGRPKRCPSALQTHGSPMIGGSVGRILKPCLQLTVRSTHAAGPATARQTCANTFWSVTKQT